MQNASDAAIKPLNHAVGLRGPELGQTMLNSMAAADLIEGMLPLSSRCPVAQKRSGNALPLFSQDLGDDEESGLDQALEKGTGMPGALAREYFYINPARGPVDSGKQILPIVFIST